jgi:DNA-binding SARP family transcriptional activator/tetratricopeptide (TPR) repeat protein
LATDVRITLLGGFEVIIDGRRVPAAEWRRRQAAALVKMLALVPGRSLHRERVIDALWPNVDVDDAAPRLHKAAHYARRSLGQAGSVVLDGETVALFPGVRVDVDAQEFELFAEAAVAAADPGAAGRAADTYGGDLLPQDPYESWTEAPRDRLRLQYLKVLRLAERWEALTAADPGDEQAHLALIRRLAQDGDRRAAMRQFERLERGLRRELGVAPSETALRLRDELLAVDGAAPVRRPAAVALVGRDRERADVGGLLESTRQGRGQALFVVGAAGAGKTALLTCIEAGARARRMRVGKGTAAMIEGDWPYAPVLEALADLCRHHPTLLDGLDDTFRDEIERVLSGRQFSWDGQGAHQRLFVAATELLRLAAAGAGAVLVIDDAHDADDASLRLLHYLARSTITERLLIAIAHRPVATGVFADVRRSLLERRGAATLELGPLSPADAATLARRHAAAVDPAVLDAIYHSSGGLPFAVVELARAVAAGGPSATRTLVPAGLSAEALSAFTAAAVLGSAFDTDEFIGITELSDESAYAMLDEALTKRILHRTEGGYAFRHALVRESLLGAASHDDRRAAHLRAARTLERLGRSPARIGHHLVQAGQETRAVPWILTVAETEAALGAYRDALATLQTVRTAASGADLARLLALRADLFSACADLGALNAYREALEVETDPAARTRLRTRLARAATVAGDLETAQLALAGLDLDGSDNDAALLLARGNLAFHLSDFAAADAAATEARRRIALGARSWRLFDLVTLQGLLAHYRGEWFQRLRVELRNGMHQPDLAVGIFDSHLCVAEYLLYGPTPYDEVLELAGELRDTAERAGVLRAVAFALALRGEAALLKGDLDLAETELHAAADLHHDLESPAGEAHSLQRLAEVQMARGDRAAANRLLQRALPLARWSSIGQHLLHRVYGCMITAAPDLEAARAVVDRAESTLGREDSCIFCSIMLEVPAAQACADMGELDEAHRHLRAAERSLRLWEGTAWEASLMEARGHVAHAERRDADAQRLFIDAAARFEAAGQPLDAQRCRVRRTQPDGGAEAVAARHSTSPAAVRAVSGTDS